MKETEGDACKLQNKKQEISNVCPIPAFSLFEKSTEDLPQQKPSLISKR